MLFNVILLYAEVFSAPGEWRQLGSSNRVKIRFKGFLYRLTEENDKTPPLAFTTKAADPP